MRSVARILDRHEHAEVDEVDEVAAARERDPRSGQIGAVLDDHGRQLEHEPLAEVLPELGKRGANADDQLLLELRTAEDADGARPPAAEEAPRSRARGPECVGIEIVLMIGPE